MAAVGQVEAHDAAVRLDERRVDREVGRGAGQGLHVDAPLGGVEPEHLEGALLRQRLHLVDELVAPVVAVELTRR